MKGRKPIPEGARKWTSIKSRSRKGREPQAASALGACPKHLTGNARVMWKRVVAGWAVGQGPLKSLDHGALEAYCTTYSNYRRAQVAVAESDLVLETSGGGAMKNPALTALNEAMSQMQRFGSDLGLNPAARTRLATPESATGDEFELFRAASAE